MPVTPNPQTSSLAVVETVPAATAGFRSHCLGDAYHIRFAGVSDLVRAAAVGADRGDLHRFDFTDSYFIGREFGGFADVVKACESTWQFGCDRVEELSRELEREELPRPTVVRRRRVWDEHAGDEIDVDRWKAGEPFFRETTKVRTTGPRVIRFLVQLGANSYMGSDDLFWRGALAVTLARLVEDAGYRTEIHAFCMVEQLVIERGAPGHVTTSLELKGAGDALDVSSLVNVTSGWFYRTAMFAAWTVPNKRLCSHLGVTVEQSSPKAVEYLAAGARPWVIADVYNKAGCVALARELLAELVAESK